MNRINRYIARDKLTPALLWEHVQNDVIQSEQGYVVFGDRVLDKDHAYKTRTGYVGVLSSCISNYNKQRALKNVNVVSNVFNEITLPVLSYFGLASSP